MKGFVCSLPCYAYKGHTFEITYSGPWPLKKNGDPWAGHPRKSFWDAIDEFMALPKEQQEACRVGGGCVRF